jgi:hypothetical protein
MFHEGLIHIGVHLLEKGIRDGKCHEVLLAASHMMHPHLPSTNWMAPAGFLSDQMMATGDHAVRIALAILLCMDALCNELMHPTMRQLP